MILLLVSSLAVLVGSIAVAAALPRRGAFSFLLAVALLSCAVVSTIVLFAGAILGDLSPTTLAALAISGWPALCLGRGGAA